MLLLLLLMMMMMMICYYLGGGVQRFPYVCHGGVVVVAVVVSVDFLSDPCEILIPQNPGTLTLM